MRMIIQSRLIVFLDYECGQQLQEHQKCCRQSGRNDRMSIKGIYDIHCHIVPGVDDGATDIGETVKLLRMEYEQGVRTVITTPHFRFRMFETPAEKVREQFRLVEKAASEIGYSGGTGGLLPDRNHFYFHSTGYLHQFSGSDFLLTDKDWKKRKAI